MKTLDSSYIFGVSAAKNRSLKPQFTVSVFLLTLNERTVWRNSFTITAALRLKR